VRLQNRGSPTLFFNYIGHYLKLWADKWTFSAESKGFSRVIRPKKLVVVSNYHPKDIWGEETVMYKAVCRRFHIRNIVALKKFDDTKTKKRRVGKTRTDEEKAPPLFRQNADGNLGTSSFFETTLRLVPYVDLQPRIDDAIGLLVEAAADGRVEDVAIEEYDDSVNVSQYVEDSNYYG